MGNRGWRWSRNTPGTTSIGAIYATDFPPVRWARPGRRLGWLFACPQGWRASSNWRQLSRHSAGASVHRLALGTEQPLPERQCI
jgi:hypothetical protein